jgi:hypothetical protein
MFVDNASFIKISLLVSRTNISLKKFWSFASEYGIERFAIYILSLYSEQKKTDLSLPQKHLYPSLLTFKMLQKLYPLLPQKLKVIIFKVPFVEKPVTYFFTKSWQYIRKKCIKTFSFWYIQIMKRLAKQVIINNEHIVYRKLSNSILINAKEYSVSGSISENERLFISASTGLWVLNENRIQQLTAGLSYGITRIENRWYLYQSIGEYSRIISFRIDLTNKKSKMHDIRIELSGLPLCIHQIDSFNKDLFITDTLKNRVMCLNKNKKRTFIYPNKKIKDKIPYMNNNHFNSIYITESYIYILAHNGWFKPKQNSQIFIVSRLTHKIINIIDIDAQEAHNIVFYKNKWMYCDSLGGVVKWGNARFFTDKMHYLRGLAVTQDSIFVGASQIIKRGKRHFSDSIVWFLGHKGEVKKSIELEKIGQINEIRSTGFDYGLSESWKKGK